MQWIPLIVVAVCVFVGTLALTGIVLKFLRSRAILDYPNQRSSHMIPTPKGAGIAVICCISIACIIVSWSTPMEETVFTIILAVLTLALFSWFDDLRGISPLWRLLLQICAVAFVILMPWSSPSYEMNIFNELLPIGWGYFVVGLIWVWFINLFNFMDGIDGISGLEMATIGVGISLVVLLTGLTPLLGLLGVIVAASALGFLVWNWHPAKIFLGDVGSVPLGFLLGWLLLQLANHGQWAAALILPLYYLGDGTLTLIIRIIHGKKIWHAHHEHFYQQAVSQGFSHAEVVQNIFLINVLLIVLATISVIGWGWQLLTIACVIVSWLLFILSTRNGPGKL